MNATRLTILGAGSVRCSVPVIASLATYFGERPLEIRMYDADVERLDLFDRLARVCFVMAKNEHSLVSTNNLEEACEGAERVVLQVGENCARRFLKERRKMGVADLEAAAMIEQAVEEMLGAVPAEAEVLNLQRPDIAIPRSHFYRVDWIAEPSLQERFGLPHQVLRWIRGEDYPHSLLNEFEKSPLKGWLDNVDSLERVGERERGS